MFETIKSQLYIGKTLVQQNELKGRGFEMKLDVTDESIKATLVAKADITMKSLEIVTDKDFDDDDLFFANGYQAWTTTREFSKEDTFNGLMKIAGITKFTKHLQGRCGRRSFLRQSWHVHQGCVQSSSR